MNWLSDVLYWYGMLFLLGFLFWPVTRKFFGSFIDGGYGLSKTFGIIVLTYLVYLLGTIRLVPFTKEGLLLILAGLIFFVFRFFRSQLRDIRTMSRKRWLLVAAVEALCFSSFLWLVIVRAQEPSIRGLEKFMDFGFMKSALRTEYFPALDMWLSGDPNSPNGYPINYYYFGHLSGAVLTKLTGISPFITYNLILGTILAQGMTIVFSLGATLIQRLRESLHVAKKRISPIPSILMGLLAAWLVNFAGNLHTIYIFTSGYTSEKPYPFWKIWQTAEAISKTMDIEKLDFLSALVKNSSYWYPNATRFIPFTIHEFPSYSYVVADLHGHVYGIPIVLLLLAGLWRVFEYAHSAKDRAEKPLALGKTHGLMRMIRRLLHRLDMTKRDIGLSASAFFLGSMVAIAYMTNAFDGPIYILFVPLVFFTLYRFSKKILVLLPLIVAGFILTALPFSAFFTPFANAIGVNCPPEFLARYGTLGPFYFDANNCQASPFWMLFVLWGFFLMSGLVLGIYLLIARARWRAKIFPTDLFVMLLFGYGLFLITVPEFFYIKDIYPGHFRANTMFKMGYQAFIMMSIGAAYAFYRVGQGWKRVRFRLQLLFLPGLLLVSFYPFLAFPSYYPGANKWETYIKAQNLNGMAWLHATFPQDGELVEYINKYIPGQPVILEAQGDSYTDYNRISAYTGNPTVAGWWVHQWLWRGSPDIVGARAPDIEALYQSKDLDYTKTLLRKYDIQYVVVSQMERDKYRELYEDKFTKIGTKVFESKNKVGALYKVY